MNEFHKIIKIGAIILAIFIIVLIINGIFMFANMFINDDNDNNIVQVYENINDIEIDLNNSNLIIKRGEEFKVEANNVSNSFKVKKNNATLKIEESNFWFFNNNAGEVIVYVPSNIDELNIDTGAGKITVDDIYASKFELDSGAGVVSVSNSNFDRTNIDGGTGTIDVLNTTLSNLDLDVGVGEVNINGEILGNSKIDCGIGEVNLTLLGGESLYKLDIDSGIGDIKINDANFNDTIYGNGSNKVEIYGGIGSINIYFN